MRLSENSSILGVLWKRRSETNLRDVFKKPLRPWPPSQSRFWVVTISGLFRHQRDLEGGKEAFWCDKLELDWVEARSLAAIRFRFSGHLVVPTMTSFPDSRGYFLWSLSSLSCPINQPINCSCQTDWIRGPPLASRSVTGIDKTG